MAQLEFISTPIEGLLCVQRHPIIDARGSFGRFYCQSEFAAQGFSKPIQQINHSHTASAGTVRGMHYQSPPHAETKLVSCLRGKIFDVAVDLRRDSATFLHWHAEILSDENRRGLLIPEGFAHGFQTLTDDCELIYLHTAAYNKEAEGALNPLDPKLNIAWPSTITEMSERDRTHPMLSEDFKGLVV
jgi:dTDP-4-dehydrorhamnose 3,5-epimerase